jgi:hypothetical protein
LRGCPRAAEDGRRRERADQAKNEGKIYRCLVLKKTGPLRAVAGSWRLEGRGVWHILTKQKSTLISHTSKEAENGDERKKNKEVPEV